MTAIERWREMILREHAQSDSMRPEPPEADFWTPYARNFGTDPRREGDELLDFLLTQVTPEDTLIDVGAGGGRLALPLALNCRRVVAVEPSPSMCAVLRETAAEHNIDNVSLVESDWLNATVGQAEIVLCSHVVYVVQDIGPFVRKLEDSAARRVLVVVYQAPPQSQTYPLWGRVHGTPRLPLPSLPEFREVLAEMDISPAISPFPGDPPRGFDSMEDALNQLTRRLYVAAGSPQAGRLEAVLPEVLEERDGVYQFKDAQRLIPTIVSWEPRRS